MIPRHVVEAVLARAEDYCEGCGLPARGKMDLHHRKLRSQGGLHTVENLAFVHHDGHMAIHASPTRSYALGHMVRRNDDPAEISMQILPGLCMLG